MKTWLAFRNSRMPMKRAAERRRLRKLDAYPHGHQQANAGSIWSRNAEREAMVSVRLLVLTVVAMFISALPASAKTYDCMEEDAAGFSFKDGSWQQVSFVQKRFLLRFDGKTLVIDSQGETLSFDCKNSWDEEYLFICTSNAQAIFFNTAQMAFNRSWLLGRLSERSPTPTGDSLRIAYGSCKPFD